jgi:STE24 endopeptidase
VSARRTSLAVVVTALAVFVVLALVSVPWDPVPGGPLSTPDPYRYFTAAEIQRGEDFARWARVWSWSSLAVSLLVLGAVGFTRAGRALVARLPGRWWVQVPLAVAAVEVGVRLVTLPFAVALRRHVLDYGLSHQAWGAFAVDLAKSEALDVGVTSLALVVLVACARRWPRAWPAVAGGCVAVLVLLGSLVYPVVVEPMFNSFTPLPDGPLRTRILDLADREGVDVDDVLVADASRRTTTLNAYVSGFGSTRRVVVYDNLVDDLGEDEAVSVVAHELSHAEHQDVLVGSALGAAGAALGVGLLALLLPGRRNGGVADPRSVPRILALVAVAGLLASPVQNGISRRVETRADVDALRVTQDPAAFVAVQQQLARRSLADLTPPAWSQAWFGSHPTTLSRIALAERAATDSVLPAAGGARDALAGVLEDVPDVVAEGEHDDDDERGDAGDEKAVLDGRRAPLGAHSGRHHDAEVVQHDHESPGVEGVSHEIA